MKSIIVQITVISIGTLLIGCTSTHRPQQDLSTYLDSFVGQSTNQLQSQLNFQQFGYHATQHPIATSEQAMIYRIQRPVRIPLPTFSGGMSSSGNWTGSSGGSMAESYNVDFDCDIKFHLQQNIVTKWSYTGKGC